MNTAPAFSNPLVEQDDRLKLQLTLVLPRSSLGGGTPEAAARSVQAYLGRGIPSAGGAVYPMHVTVDHIRESSTTPNTAAEVGFKDRWALVATVEFLALLTMLILALSYVDFDAAFAKMEHSLELWPTTGKRLGHSL